MCEKLNEAVKLTKKVNEEYGKYEQDRDPQHLKTAIKYLNKKTRLVKQRMERFATML